MSSSEMWGLRVLIRLWKTYRLFPQVLWKTYKNCETLCVANCVGSEIYVGGVLTFMRSCDSLHAKITRFQRAYKHSKDLESFPFSSSPIKRKLFHSYVFLAIFLKLIFPQLFQQPCGKAFESHC